MDEPLLKALARYLREVEPAVVLGRPAHPERPADGAEAKEREARAFEELMRRRDALIEGSRWQTLVPTIAIVAFAAAGVVFALFRGSLANASVAVAAAIAAMFRLLQVVERAQHRRMIFTAIQLSGRGKGSAPVDLVRLLLESEKQSANRRVTKDSSHTAAEGSAGRPST